MQCNPIHVRFREMEWFLCIMYWRVVRSVENHPAHFVKNLCCIINRIPLLLSYQPVAEQWSNAAECSRTCVRFKFRRVKNNHGTYGVRVSDSENDLCDPEVVVGNQYLFNGPVPDCIPDLVDAPGNRPFLR